MTTFRSITVKPCDAALGAFITDVDLRQPTAEQRQEIRQAFVDYSVIFFRGQDLSPAEHIRFAEHWGKINVNRFFRPVDGYSQIAEVRKEPDQTVNIGRFWHTDHSYDQIPALGSILLAREVPEGLGDTMYASMYAAYEGLSQERKDLLNTLQAHHSSRHAFGNLTDDNPNKKEIGDRLANPEAATQDALHPVVIRHPLSGRPALYVNHDFTVRFEGWTVEDSAALLEELYDHATQPEYTYRFRWEPGSIAIWDNRATHHKAINDYDGHRRLMHRITIEGEALSPAFAPVG